MSSGKRNTFGISYSWLMVTTMIVLTTVVVLDRFSINVYPMYLTYSYSDMMSENDWPGITYFIVSWVIIRELLISSSFIYLLQCKCFWNYIFEHKPKWLLVDDIHYSNTKLHSLIGWLTIAIPMLIHLWLVFLPLINYPINNMHIYYDQWMRPVNRKTHLCVEKYHQHTIHLALTDIYALMIITFIFCIIFPLSTNQYIKHRYWTKCKYLHLTAASLYTIELLRTPFTCNAWLICTPFILMYMTDKLIGSFYYRYTNEAKLICKCNIGDNYAVLLIHVPGFPKKQYNYNTNQQYFGNIFWFNVQKSFGKYLFAHPFYTFFNHQSNNHNTNAPDYILNETLSFLKQEKHNDFRFGINYKYSKCTANYSIQNSETTAIDLQTNCDIWLDLKSQKNYKWNVGVIMRVHHKHRDNYQELSTHYLSFTEYMSSGIGCSIDDYVDYGGCTESINLNSYGPYRSSFGHIIHEVFDNVDIDDSHSVVLIATGAGVSYIIDFIFYCCVKEIDHFKSKVNVHFLCKSTKLFQWISSMLYAKEEIDDIDNLFINGELRSQQNVNELEFDTRIGVKSYQEVLRNSVANTKVFFCGSPAVQNNLIKLCKELKFKLYQSKPFR